jgi:DNA-binding MarR family transcriptional regulator
MESTAITSAEVKPGPEDHDLAARLGSLLAHLLRTYGAEIGAIEESGLGFTQVKLLFSLGTDPDPVPLNQLADRLGISLPASSRAVDGLVKRGFATRSEDSDDRRVRLVSITAKGDRLVDRIATARLAGLERFVAALSAAERRKLTAALEELGERDEVAALYESFSGRARR